MTPRPSNRPDVNAAMTGMASAMASENGRTSMRKRMMRFNVFVSTMLVVLVVVTTSTFFFTMASTTAQNEAARASRARFEGEVERLLEENATGQSVIRSDISSILEKLEEARVLDLERDN